MPPGARVPLVHVAVTEIPGVVTIGQVMVDVALVVWPQMLVAWALRVLVTEQATGAG